MNGIVTRSTDDDIVPQVLVLYNQIVFHTMCADDKFWQSTPSFAKACGEKVQQSISRVQPVVTEYNGCWRSTPSLGRVQ